MIIALANSKGGVGKSTIAVHLAVWLFEQKKKVIFVDSDVQASSSMWLAEACPELKKIRLLTADDVLNQVPGLSEQNEFVVADGPAGLSQVTRALMYLTDLAVFPCGPSVLDLRAVIDAISVLKQIKQVRKGKPEAIIVPNKLQSQYRLSRELMETVRTFDMPSGDGLKLRQAYADAAGQGTVVWRMQTPSAREASGEMQYLFQQLIQHESKSQNIDQRAHRSQPVA